MANLFNLTLSTMFVACSAQAIASPGQTMHSNHVESRHQVTYDDIASASVAGEGFSIAARSERVAYVKRKTIFVKEVGDRTIGANIGSGFDPKWAPDGRRLAYYSSVGGSLQLWIYDVLSREAKVVTALPGGINPDPIAGWFAHSMDREYRFDWSPDGQRIVLASRVVQRAEDKSQSGLAKKLAPRAPLILDATTPAELTLHGILRTSSDLNTTETGELGDKGVQDLFVIDLHSSIGAVKQLTSGIGGCFFPAWSPKGDLIACTTTRGHAIDGDLRDTDIVVVDSRTGDVVNETSGEGLKFFPEWAADGNRIVFLETADASDGPFGLPELYVWKRDGSDARPLIPQLGMSIETFQVAEQGGNVLFLYKNGLRTIVAVVNLDDGITRTVRTEGPERVPEGLVVTRKGEICWEITTNDNPGLIELLDLNGKRPRTIVDLNPEAASWEFGKRRTVRWNNARGEKLEGILLEPPSFDPSRAYPTIVDVYPLTRGTGWRLLGGNRLWAARGYLVFIPAPRGPHVWMNDWSTRRRYGLEAKGASGWDTTQDDVMSGVIELEQRGLIDPNHVCIYGHSNGGAVVLNVIARTQAFTCAIAVSPVMLDWLQMATIRTGMATWAKALFGSKSVYEDPTAYLEMSATYKAAGVRTPIMLAAGDHDAVDVVLPTIEMYNSLRYLGRNVILLRYSEQGHVFQDADMMDFWTREMQFFSTYLDGT